MTVIFLVLGGLFVLIFAVIAAGHYQTRRADATIKRVEVAAGSEKINLVRALVERLPCRWWR